MCWDVATCFFFLFEHPVMCLSNSMRDASYSRMTGHESNLNLKLIRVIPVQGITVPRGIHARDHTVCSNTNTIWIKSNPGLTVEAFTPRPRLPVISHLTCWPWCVSSGWCWRARRSEARRAWNRGRTSSGRVRPRWPGRCSQSAPRPSRSTAPGPGSPPSGCSAQIYSPAEPSH